MADFFLSNLKSTLDNCITELDEIHSMFCRNPESDFTRNRKLSFREYIQFMLQMQSKSVSNAVNICRAYLKHDGNETESMLLIQKYLTPVKYNRKYPIHLSPKRNRDFMYLGGDTSLSCSTDTQKEIDEKVVQLVKAEHEKARKILAENREKLDELAMYLYEKETITGDEFMDILDRK